MVRPNRRQQPHETEEPQNGSGNKPRFSQRYRAPGGGFLDLSIFQNEKDGDNTYTVFQTSIKKSYKGNDGRWASVHSFRPEELPILAIALTDAYRAINAEQNRQ